MIHRALDEQNDWRFGKGTADYARDEQAIEINIRTRLLSWLGDCFFALQDGVDWRNRLDVGQQDQIVDEIRSVILQSFGVVGVNSVDFVFERETRKFSITYEITTIYSPSFQTLVERAAGALN